VRDGGDDDVAMSNWCICVCKKIRVRVHMEEMMMWQCLIGAYVFARINATCQHIVGLI